MALLQSSTSRTGIVLAVGAALLIVAAWLAGRSPFQAPSDALVVYCAHDAEFSEPLLREFEKRTGIPVLIRLDTEATKSLGLINLLIQEKSQPRCDVFWNNELLGMLDLQEKGILQPYQGTGYARIPEQFKDPAGHWTGFAARLRVHIVNTTQLAPEPDLIERIWREEALRDVALAKPLYGTTLVQYSILTQEMGLEGLKKWHNDALERGLQVVNGNATVKNLVAQGACRMGMTDTDDFFVAKDARLPVDMIPIRVGKKRQTICIPNCVAMIQGTRHRPQAEKLIDFLLSEETELALSRSAARQIPLGPIKSGMISPEVAELAEWAREGYDLRSLQQARAACVAWLSEVYLQQAATPRPDNTHSETGRQSPSQEAARP